GWSTWWRWRHGRDAWAADLFHRSQALDAAPGDQAPGRNPSRAGVSACGIRDNETPNEVDVRDHEVRTGHARVQSAQPGPVAVLAIRCSLRANRRGNRETHGGRYDRADHSHLRKTARRHAGRTGHRR